MVQYEGNGVVRVGGLASAPACLRINPGRYQAFRFLLGDLCGIPGSMVPNRIVRATFNGTGVVYLCEDVNGERTEVPEDQCLELSGLRGLQLEAANLRYIAAAAKLNRLTLGG